LDRITLIVVNADNRLRELLSQLSLLRDKQSGIQRPTGINVARSYATFHELSTQMAATPAPDVLLVDVNALKNETSIAEMARIIRVKWPGTAVIISGPKLQVNPQTLRSHGIVHSLVRPCTVSDAVRVVLQAAAQSDLASETRNQGHVIAVHSPRAGSGASFVAVNLALALRTEMEMNVGLLDLDLQLGDVEGYLPCSTAQPYTVADVHRKIGILEPKLVVEQMMHLHPSGIRILPAPRSIDDASTALFEQSALLLLALRAQFDYLVVDTASYPNDGLRSIFEHSDRILLVCGVDQASINAVKYFQMLAARIDGALEKVLLLPNKLRYEQLQGPLTYAERALNTRFEVGIPFDRDAGFRSSTLHKPTALDGWKTPSGRTFMALSRYIVREMPVSRARKH
jgi:pilus assembly protein CpaE